MAAKKKQPSFRKAQKAYVKKKTAAGSALGVNPKRDTPAKKAKRKAAATHARQAGGTGRLMGGPKKLSPKKTEKVALYA